MTAGTADRAMAPGARLAPLADRLERARRRSLSVRLVDGALTALAVALAAFLAWPILFPPADEVAAHDPLLYALGIGAALFLVAAAVSFLRPQTIDTIARAADREFGLEERSSTAVEVIASGRMTPMARALIDDTAARAGTVEPKRLAPLFQPGRIAAAIALAAFVAMLVFAPRSAPVASRSAEAVPETIELSETARAEVAAEVRRAAELIGQDAERRDDPYLQAVARELTRVGDAIAAGKMTESGEMRAELERLASFAADGYQRAGETAGSAGDLSRAVSGALDAVNRASAETAAERTPANAPAEQAEPRGVGNKPAGDGQSNSEAPGPEMPTGIPERSETITSKGSGGFQARPEGAPTDATDTASAVCDGETDASCFVITPRIEVESVIGDARGIELAGGAPNAGEAPPKLDNGVLLGPAPKSGAAESYEAGRGVEAIGGGQAADPTSYAAGGEVRIDNQRFASGGDRIRVDAVPQPGSQPLPQGGQQGSEAWQALPEIDVGRVMLPPRGRDVVARYFTQ